MNWSWFAIKLILFVVVSETLFISTLYFSEKWLNEKKQANKGES